MSKARRSKARFKIGDWVSFPYGIRKVVAQIIEDRGPIGFKGYRIQLPIQDSEPDRFEVREEDMTAAAPPGKTAKVS